jgi:hypothetical protein
MTKTTAVLAALLLVSPVRAQEGAGRPPKRRDVRSEVRILVEERPDGEFDHDYYEQLLPVEYRSGSAGAQSTVWFRTVCRPQEEDRPPVWIPARPAPSSPAFPLSVSAAAGIPRVRVRATPAQVLTITGSARNDPGTTPPTGPTLTKKPALFGGAAEDSRASSDAPILYGPDFDLVVSSDVARWLPEGTSLHLFARALFGEVEMFDTPTDLQFYAVGPRLTVPLLKSGSFVLGVTASAGPAFLHSALGDAVGFDGALGLRLEHLVGPAVSIVAAAEANLYFSEHVTSFGPVVHLGLNLAW